MTRLFYIFWLRVCVSWVCVSAGCVCVCVSLVSQELKRDCTTHRWLWEWKERRRPKSRSTSSTTRHTHQSSCVCVCVLRCATTDTHALDLRSSRAFFFFSNFFWARPNILFFSLQKIIINFLFLLNFPNVSRVHIRPLNCARSNLLVKSPFCVHTSKEGTHAPIPRFDNGPN